MIKVQKNPKLATKVARLVKYCNRKKSGDKSTIVPNVKLNNGRRMPILGLGTWQSSPGVAVQVIMDAIDIGYRHIDCAHFYQNECEIGEGIKCKIDEGVVKRSALFITSKLWNTFHRPDLVRPACETTLRDLNTPYLDMYLMHWPTGWKEEGDLVPRDEDGKTLYSDVDYVDTWKEMEKLVDHGLCKSIGVSNFNSKQLERVLKIACIPPATNQVESHPYLNQKKLMKYCKGKNIVITAYSPLGSPKRTLGNLDVPVVMEDPEIVSIAKKHKKTPAQILIRYQITRGNAVIPKSMNKKRLASNFDVFNFDLCDEDIEAIDCLDCNGRLIDFVDEGQVHPHYPFDEKF